MSQHGRAFGNRVQDSRVDKVVFVFGVVLMDAVVYVAESTCVQGEVWRVATPEWCRIFNLAFIVDTLTEDGYFILTALN